MDEYERQVYFSEVAAQCRFALNAARCLENVLPRLTAAQRARNHLLARLLHDEVFRSIHSFLGHASNISRLLWTSLPRRRRDEGEVVYNTRCAQVPRVKRARELRKELALPEEHLLKNRALRAHLVPLDGPEDSPRL